MLLQRIPYIAAQLSPSFLSQLLSQTVPLAILDHNQLALQQQNGLLQLTFRDITPVHILSLPV